MVAGKGLFQVSLDVVFSSFSLPLQGLWQAARAPCFLLGRVRLYGVDGC